MTQDDLASTLLGNIYRRLPANTDIDDFPETGLVKFYHTWLPGHFLREEASSAPYPDKA